MSARRAAAGWIWVALFGLSAQSLSLPPSTVRRGSSGSLLIALDAPAGKALTALQWQIQFPAGISVDLSDIVAGSAAESAQKSLTCAPAKGGGPVFNCILAGGRQTIGNGTIAITRYRASAGRAGSLTVHVEKIVGAAADLKRVDIPAVEGVITVQ